MERIPEMITRRQRREPYRKAEMAVAWALDGGRCVRCGRRTEGPPHHFLIGADRHIGLDWMHRDYVGTLCGAAIGEQNCHYWADTAPRAEVAAWLEGLSRRPGFRFGKVLEFYAAKYSPVAV